MLKHTILTLPFLILACDSPDDEKMLQALDEEAELEANEKTGLDPEVSGQVKASGTTSAAGWTQNYAASLGSETYKLLYNNEVRGSCQAKSNATIILKDWDADGFGQRVYWRVSGAPSWTVCNHTGGDGTQKPCTVTSNKFIQYRFCIKDGPEDVACADVDGFQT